MKAVNALVIALLVVQAPLAFASTAGNIGLNHKAGEAKLTQDQIEAKARAATKGSTGRAEAPVAVTTKRVAAPKAAAPKAAAAKPAPAPAAAPALAGNEAAVKSDIIEAAEIASQDAACKGKVCETTITNMKNNIVNPSENQLGPKPLAKLKAMALKLLGLQKKNLKATGKANTPLVLERLFDEADMVEAEFNGRCGRKS